MNFIFSNLEDLFCGFFFIYNSNIFIYLKQKILENIFYFISNNSIIILTHGEKILNLKVQGQIMDKFLVWRTKFLYRMSLMAGRAWMIVAHFVSWKRKWRRCSPFVQRLWWILHTGRGAFCLLTILYFLVPLRFHDAIANIINHKSYINLSNIWRCGYWPSDSLLHITVVRECNLRNLFLF